MLKSVNNFKKSEIEAIANRISPEEYFLLCLIRTNPITKSMAKEIEKAAAPKFGEGVHQFDIDQPFFRLAKDDLIGEAKKGNGIYGIFDKGIEVLKLLDQKTYDDLKIYLIAESLGTMHSLVLRYDSGSLEVLFKNIIERLVQKMNVRDRAEKSD
ncbi:MAG: hypothetical protein KGH71_01580 [Candidatus Micrarchaeota archaeon]|nr:hypothetical protein [Candidatus Micrarchaeota archaeon]